MAESPLPEELHELFWEFEVSDIDTDKHIGLIVEKVTNNGDIIHIRKLLQLYNQSLLREVILKSQFRGMSAKNIVFWSTILHIPRKTWKEFHDRCLDEPWSYNIQ